MAYSAERSIPVDFSSAAKSLRTPWMRICSIFPTRVAFLRIPGVHRRSRCGVGRCSPEAAPDSGVELTLTFEAGDVVAIDGEPMSLYWCLRTNKVGGAHGVGRWTLLKTVT